MKDLRLVKLMLSYIETKKRTLLMLLLFASVFTAILFLYRIETEATLYAAVMCLFLSAVYGVVDFSAYCKRHSAMTNMRSHVIWGLDDLPAPRDLTERDYDELIRIIYDEKNRVQLESDSAETDASEYYSLWVHQIKTPIAAMRLLLDSDCFDPTAAAAELLKIEQYTEMVLTYQRLHSDTTDYLFANYAVDEIIRKALRHFAPLFIQKKITLDYSGTELVALTDKKWLLFAVEQILSNALKYTKCGTIKIYTEDHLLFIEDSGIGIAKEDLPRIGEKGFTGYNGRNDNRSTGLGLYLCKTIFGKLGHVFIIESEPGKGTKVTIDLSSADVEIE